MRINRRTFGQHATSLVAAITLSHRLTRQANAEHTGTSSHEAQHAFHSVASDRLSGLLIGGLLGDALGGPVEFAERDKVRDVLPNCRKWPNDRKLTTDDCRELARTLPLLSYETLRPDTAPYGPWVRSAPAGTVTDDTRHKIILMRTLAAAAQQDEWPVTARSLAKQYIAFQPRTDRSPNHRLAALCREGLLQYRYAAQWLLGERDLRVARPIERLWAGIDNCSGQMLLPPLAAIYAGAPAAAYRAAFAIDFVDTPGARDLAAAVVAGLATVLDPKLDDQPVTKRWQCLLKAMRETDPYGVAEVPFAGRPLHKWIDLAHSLAHQAGRTPAELFRLLEQEGRSEYGWDAHFTVLCPLAILKFCNYDSLASLHLTLDFGHDTDSCAQLLGCLAGAVEGEQLFPAAMRRAVQRRLKADYGESLFQWAEMLQGAARRFQANQAVIDQWESPREF